MFTSNAKEFNAELKSFIPEFEADFKKNLIRLVQVAHKSLVDKTPVHTGRTVRNYILTMDTPHGGFVEALSGGVPPGRTSQMPLGPEPRREMNATSALGTQAALNLSETPYRSIWISNNAPDVVALEMGLLPTKQKNRGSGMLENTFLLLMQEVGIL